MSLVHLAICCAPCQGKLLKVSADLASQDAVQCGSRHSHAVNASNAQVSLAGAHAAHTQLPHSLVRLALLQQMQHERVTVQADSKG